MAIKSFDVTVMGTPVLVNRAAMCGCCRADVYPLARRVLQRMLVAGVGVILAIACARNADAASGDMDTSFDGVGWETFADIPSAVYPYWTRVGAVAVQSDRKIIIAGDGGSGFALTRLNADGTTDASFGLQGSVNVGFSGSNEEAAALAVQTNGKIVVAGIRQSTTYRNIAIVRLNANGRLDTTFSGDGKLSMELGVADEQVSDIALQLDGKIVLAATAGSAFAVIRLTTAGGMDTSFSLDGKASVEFGTSTRAWVSAVAVQSDGKLVVAGGVELPDGTENFAVARLNANGSPDNTFSGDGKLRIGFSGDPYWEESSASDVVLQSDGKIVVAGRKLRWSGDDRQEAAVARLNSNGTLDNSFSLDGKATLPGDGLWSYHARTVAIQPDGRILLIGEERLPDYTYLLLGRLNPDGTVDVSFGAEGDGIAMRGLDDYTTCQAATVQPWDGRVVIVGTTTYPVPEVQNPSWGYASRFHTIACNNVNVTRIGSWQNDVITGTSGRDVIHGFGGNDQISGLAGDDLICGGNGNDTLNGGDGNDTLLAGNGNDVLNGGAGTDVCNGGSNADTATSCETRTGVP